MSIMKELGRWFSEPVAHGIFKLKDELSKEIKQEIEGLDDRLGKLEGRLTDIIDKKLHDFEEDIKDDLGSDMHDLKSEIEGLDSRLDDIEDELEDK